MLGIFEKPPGGSLAKGWESAETAASEVGTSMKRSRNTGLPPPHTPRFSAVKEKRRAFSHVFTLSLYRNHATLYRYICISAVHVEVKHRQQILGQTRMA